MQFKISLKLWHSVHRKTVTYNMTLAMWVSKHLIPTVATVFDKYQVVSA